jgi:predicted nucleic acid-binding protein
VTGVQVLNKFVATARRKLGFSWEEVLESIAAIRILCPSVAPLTIETHGRALHIAQRYGYHVFDALVITAALEASSSALYTGDMQDGQRNRNAYHPQSLFHLGDRANFGFSDRPET